MLDRYKLIRVPVDVYQVSHVPFTVLPLDFVLVVVADRSANVGLIRVEMLRAAESLA